MAVGFLEADLVAFGSIDSGEGRHRRRASNRNIVSNNEMMRQVNELDNTNAWAVGRFDAIASKVGPAERSRSQRCPPSRGSRRPATSTAASAACSRPRPRTRRPAKNLRDVVRGFLALAKMQAGNKPGMQQMVDSLQLSGDGKTVALAFAVPSEVLDVLEGHGQGTSARSCKQ